MTQTLRFVTLRAENLIPQDGDSCDPYVIVRVGDRTFKTEKITANHRNPEWHVLAGFQFPWDGVSSLPEIEFTLNDHDYRGGDDFIGYARCQLHPSKLGQEVFVPLTTRSADDEVLLKDYDTLGKIIFCIESNSPNPEYREQGFYQREATSPIGAQPMGGSPIPKGSPNRRQPNRSGKVRLVKLRGDHLAPVDGDTCDPYVKMIIHTKPVQEKTTETLKKTQAKCEWKECGFSFDWDGHSPLPTIDFLVTDWNMVFSNEFIGKASQHLHPAMFGTETRVNLIPEGSEGSKSMEKFGTLGELYFVLEFIPDSSAIAANRQLQQQQNYPVPEYTQQQQQRKLAHPTSPYEAQSVPKPGRHSAYDHYPSADQREEGYLILTIEEAVNLLCTDVGGTFADPFVVLKGEKEDGEVKNVARTKTEEDSKNPKWRETLKVPLSLGYSRFWLEVRDLDPGGKSEFLGHCELPFHPTQLSDGQHKFMKLLPFTTKDEQKLRQQSRQDFGGLIISWENTPSPGQFQSPYAPRKKGWHPRGSPTTNENEIDDVEEQKLRKLARNPKDEEKLRHYLYQKHRHEYTDAQQLHRFVEVRIRELRDGTKQPAARHSYIHSTVLSVTNLPQECNPYVRVRYRDAQMDNRQDAGRMTSFVVWNFDTQFPIDDTSFSHEVTYEVLSDGRLLGQAKTMIGRDAVKPKTVVLPIHGPGGQICGELTAIIAMKVAAKHVISYTLEEAVVNLCVVSAHSLAGTRMAMMCPYVIVTVQGAENEIEYVSPSIRGTTTPMWYFQVPEMKMQDDDTIVISVWDEDSFGFDRSLGQTKLEASRFLQGATQLELQLEDREGEQPQSHFGKVVMEWSTYSRNKRPSNTAPHVVEITVHEAKNLAKTLNPAALVRISCDDQPSTEITTKVAPKSSPQWDETLQLRVDGLHNRLRLSLWDSEAKNAEFLGECFIDLASQSIAKQTSVALRPRQDAHFYSDDVSLLNRTPTGLGTVSVSLQSYSVREYETKVRERLRSRGASYSVVLQISDTSDIPQRGTYYVKVVAAGTELYSQCETGSHPKFRKNFDFNLQYDTEMMVISLYQREGEMPQDFFLGDVSFAVNPPERIGVEPITTWVSVNGPGSNPERPIKLLVRWRTTRKVQGGENALQMPSYNSQMENTPSRHHHRGNEDQNVNAMRNELSNLRQELDFIRSGQQSPSQFQQYGGGGGAGHPPLSAPYQVHVYAPQQNKIYQYNGTLTSTVGDIINQATRALDLFYPDQYALVFRGSTLPISRYAQEFLPSGETVFLLPNTSISMQQEYAPQQQVYQPQQIQNNNNAMAMGANPMSYQVIERFMSYGPDIPVVTACVSIASNVMAPLCSSVVQVLSARQISGFTRPVEGNFSASEFFVQGVPQKIAEVLREIINMAPSGIIEEVKGYIPILSPGFRVATNPTDGARMFEVCSLVYQQGEEKSWFYKAVDEGTVPSLGVRYIDERE